MLIEYKIKPRFDMFKSKHRRNWIELKRLDIKDIDKVGNYFYLRIDGKIYDYPAKELEQIVLWQELIK